MILLIVYCAALVPIVLCEENILIGNIGDTVQLNCTLNNNIKNYKQLRWSKLWIKEQPWEPELLALGSEIVVLDDRFSVNYDNRSSTYSLKINDVQVTDEGIYQCHLIISMRKIFTADVKIQLSRPPKIVEYSYPGENFTQGMQLHFKCAASGFPKPSVSWIHNDKVVSRNGSDYFVAQARRADSGLYQCVAENNVGIEDRISINFQLKFKPVVTALRRRVYQAVGYDVNLECKVEAYPPPTISWYKNGKLLKEKQVEKGGDVFVDTFKLYGVKSSDYGDYVCRSENNLGIVETKIKLSEAENPVIVIY